MDGYQWFINGIKYPTRDVLTVKLGERVEMVLTNKTPMGHPMHLHDHAEVRRRRDSALAS